MKRRQFFRSLSALGATMVAPQFFTNQEFIKKAHASVAGANVVFPNVRPQVINIFMYGGASELAGNLTNIGDITANSQNPYPDSVVTTNDMAGGQITPNGFWGEIDGVFNPNPANHNGAGGSEMEALLANGHMSIYRTINRIKVNTRAHRPSIQSSQKGILDFETSSGMGTKLAALLVANQGAFASKYGKAIEDLVLPFVSFEGDSTALSNDGDLVLPLSLKGVSLDIELNNPYERSGDTSLIANRIDDLVSKISPPNRTDRYLEVVEQFNNREILEPLVGDFKAQLDSTPLIPAGTTLDLGPLDASGVPEYATAAVNGRVKYPANNEFADRLKVAVTLALNNPDSLFIAVGTGGLGGWDDHDNAIPKYEERMRKLMKAMRAAMLHIQFAGDPNNTTADAQGLSTAVAGRRTDNIIINIHGDFGRNVNLNSSFGWDHGNNQNLYTFGGAAIRQGGAAALGKVVGKTRRIGETGENRQFTDPTDDSYQAEPMSIAASVYSYFGVQNPEVMTADPIYNPAGDPAIDETVAGEPPLF